MNDKIYLGISLGFNSSACVMSTKNGVLAAVSQERLNNIKNTKEIPFDAILSCLREANVKKIDEIAIGHYEDIGEAYFKKYENPRFPNKGYSWKDYIFNFLKDEGFEVAAKDIYRVDHQTGHRNSGLAFYGIPDKPYYTISSDGFGDGLSATIAYNANGKEDVISKVVTENSIALVYQFVTGALGFKEHQHEGKITGLAAYGKPKYIEDFENMYTKVDYGNGLQFDFDKGHKLTDDEKKTCMNNPIRDFDKFWALKMTVYELVKKLTDNGASREDLASTVQEFSEKWTLSWLKKAVGEKNTNCDAYLAGGLFANVKINQRIKDAHIFNDVNVTPPMGDEGTCAGACIELMKLRDELTFKVENQNAAVVSGPSVLENTEELVKKAKEIMGDKFDEVNVKEFKKDSDVIEYASQALADNKIVCLMKGKMEFGPRALCHRTIFYNADAYETNGWLNKKLARTEFMPFAPVTIDKFADDLFMNLDGGRKSAQFMTMTFDAKKEFIDNCKAACHIDNTARPQILTKENDAFAYKLIEEYNKKTGKKALINTSFNLHNYPIIYEEKVGIESWEQSGCEILIIENVAFELKNPEKHE